ALVLSAPAMAMAPAAEAPAAAADANAVAPDANATAVDPSAAAAAPEAPTEIKNAGKLTPVQMFIDATPIVRTIMIGLVLASVLTWTLLIIKIIEFMGLNRASDRF